jgi:uncharacterized membrane protein YhaH (DUF805 family)|tara:strand:- start:2650 stop:3012 length:363 start_codon:yes stop_codon:yes gene_type:complete
MNFGESISTCFGKYFSFNGRASRSEFWWFQLFAILLNWGAMIAGAAGGGTEGADVLSAVSSLVTLIPILAAGSRRLHDVNKSGWWQLISLTVIGIIPLIIWFASVGHKGKNQFKELPTKK